MRIDLPELPEKPPPPPPPTHGGRKFFAFTPVIHDGSIVWLQFMWAKWRHVYIEEYGRRVLRHHIAEEPDDEEDWTPWDPMGDWIAWLVIILLVMFGLFTWNAYHPKVYLKDCSTTPCELVWPKKRDLTRLKPVEGFRPRAEDSLDEPYSASGCIYKPDIKRLDCTAMEHPG